MSDTIRIGDLRHRLLLEEPLRAPDGAGGAIESHALVAELWGHVRPVSGAERLTADRIAGRITHEIWLRHRVGVAPAMRLRLGARVFDIRAVLDIEERRRWLKCLVEEQEL